MSKTDRDQLLKELLKKPVEELLSNLDSENATLKYQSSKALIQLSETNPQKVYPFFAKFASLLDSQNNIIKWTGIIIIGNLASIDQDKKIDQILPRLFSELNTGKMITAGNTAQALGNIAKNKPELADGITSELLKVENYKYDTEECNRIACGHVIKSFESYLKLPDKNVHDFLARQTKSSRHATSLKAQKLLKKLTISK